METPDKETIRLLQATVLSDLHENYGVRKDTLQPFCVGSMGLSEEEFLDVWRGNKAMPRWMFVILVQMRVMGGPEEMNKKSEALFAEYLGVGEDAGVGDDPDEAPGGGSIGGKLGPVADKELAGVAARNHPQNEAEDEDVGPVLVENYTRKTGRPPSSQKPRVVKKAAKKKASEASGAYWGEEEDDAGGGEEGDDENLMGMRTGEEIDDSVASARSAFAMTRNKRQYKKEQDIDLRRRASGS